MTHNVVGLRWLGPFRIVLTFALGLALGPGLAVGLALAVALAVGACGPAAGDGDGDGSGHGGPERCGDAVDDDADGEVDEGCSCDLGGPRACFGGPAEARGVGACRDGEQACTGGDPEFPTWGECVGDVGPEDEACDGIDNDCDGAVDEELGGSPGSAGGGGDAPLIACGAACAFPDGDGDGWSDPLEVALGTAPDRADEDPSALDRLIFVVPYEAPPVPPAHVASAATQIARADVVILLDTTGSMFGTVSRIQPQFVALVAALAGTVDDLAFGFAGYGDFPTVGANSEYDVPFYLVHRVMTARTAAGFASLEAALAYRNIIVDGTGPWWAAMRGGDTPEQGWEALRQVATGEGITYPLTSGGTDVTPAFTPATAHPAVAPAGEEVGPLGGVGFRADAQPIIIQVTDTLHHAVPFPGTVPTAATDVVALAALEAIGAKVIGLRSWLIFDHPDLDWIADATDARVTPDAWGTGADRPADCPIGKCCVQAQDPDSFGTEVQPDPVGGECLLVFRGDRYDTNLATILAQAVTAVVRGGHYRVSARVTGDAAPFVREVSADVSPGGPCAGVAAIDTDGDGVVDTYPDLVPGAPACFRVAAMPNTTVPGEAVARRFDGTLELLAAGRASLRSVPITFVVPPACPEE